MMQNPMDYLWDEVEAYQKLGEQAYNDVVNAPLIAIREIMEELNDEVNENYPIARDFMNHSIWEKGDVSFNQDSLIAGAIAGSSEFHSIVKDSASSTIGTVIEFRADPNLSRSLYDSTLSGVLDVVGQDYTFKTP